MRFILDGNKMSRPQGLPTRVLKIYTETLTGLSHIHEPNDRNTLLCQGYVLGGVSKSREDKQNAHSKYKGGNEEPLSRIQLTGQQGVTSS